MALILHLTPLQIDFGAVRLLREECARIGIRTPPVVSDAANPRLHHGTLDAVFLPTVVQFNAAAESM